MVSTRPLISKSSSSCTNPLVTVPSAPITIGNTVTFMFHGFFSCLARSKYLSLFSLYFNFIQWSVGTAMFTIRQVLFFVDYYTVWSSGWSVWISKSQRSLCVSFSRTDSGSCVESNFNFLHNSQWTSLHTQSSLVLYVFCASLLHSLIMWLIFSSISPHNICYFVASLISSSSCHAASTDIPDPLSPLLPIIHRPGRSSGLHPISSHSCCMYVRAGRPALARLYVGVHWSTSLMSSSLLLQQCPAILVRLTWIIF